MRTLEPGASLARRERAARFRFPEDALRCLAAEALLRHALAELHELEPDPLVVAGPNGKPLLADHPGIHLNLSHSGAWVLCAVHDAPVGVDVEEMRPLDPFPLEQVLAPDERERFARLEPCEALRHFYRAWTLKESLLKAMGLGLGLDPSGIRLAVDGSGIRATHATAPVSRWRLAELSMPAGAAAAVCW